VRALQLSENIMKNTLTALGVVIAALLAPIWVPILWFAGIFYVVKKLLDLNEIIDQENSDVEE